MTHRYKIDIKWIIFDEVIPKWGKTPQYQADKPHDVTLDKPCLLSDYLPILARPPTLSKKHNADGGLWNFLQALKLLCHIQSRQVLNIYLGGKYYG